MGRWIALAASASASRARAVAAVEKCKCQCPRPLVAWLGIHLSFPALSGFSPLAPCHDAAAVRPPERCPCQNTRLAPSGMERPAISPRWPIQPPHASVQILHSLHPRLALPMWPLGPLGTAALRCRLHPRHVGRLATAELLPEERSRRGSWLVPISCRLGLVQQAIPSLSPAS